MHSHIAGSKAPCSHQLGRSLPNNAMHRHQHKLQRAQRVKDIHAQTEQQERSTTQSDVSRRIALPAAASVLVAAAGFAVLKDVFANIAGPEGKKATLNALKGEEDTREGKVRHSDEEWHQLLAPDAYRILRKAGTELPFSSPLEKEKRKGMFVCAGCGASVYRSETKFDSGTGWPSFWKPVDGGIKQSRDDSIRFLPRTEVRCSQCEGHLGHVFNDGPPPTGLRYCMNGAAMDFRPDSA